MADKINSTATIALLGMGYTLSHVLPKLDRDTVVVTVSSEEKANQIRASGYEAQCLNLVSQESVANFFKSYPEVKTIVDSVPPLRGSADPLAGVKNILAALKTRDIAKFIYLSTTGVFGGQDGEWVNAQTKPQPRTAQAEQRLHSEDLYRTAFKHLCAVRISGIYGPGRGLGISLKNGSYSLVDNGTRWSNRIHVTDLANIITALVKLEASKLPSVVCASDDEPALAKDVAEFYCARFSFAKPNTISLEQAEARGMHTLTGNQRVDNKMTKSLLEYNFKYPSFRQGAGTEFQQ